MTKEEAIKAMIEGKKVSHRWFIDNEFIYMKHGCIYDENDFIIHNFWNYRNNDSWHIGWFIFEKK